MKKTRICHLLGIEYPIIQGGMTWVANAELVAAVSNAGGLGLISPNAGMAPGSDLVDNLRSQIKKTKSLTDKPFGVNFPLQSPTVKDLIDVAIEEKVPVVTTSAGNPATFTSYLKDAGIKVLHVVASVRHAKGAEGRGVDAVIAEGYEAGGHNGFDEMPTFVLVPQVADAVEIPVVAAGGIADARGFVAALALGAEGVLMGTRFLASKESNIHPKLKEWFLTLTEADTMIVLRSINNPGRVARTAFAQKILEMEEKGATFEELLPLMRGDRRGHAHETGDTSDALILLGQGVGLIHDIPSAGEIIQGIISEAKVIMQRLQNMGVGV